jgi:hypothetical protein
VLSKRRVQLSVGENVLAVARVQADLLCTLWAPLFETESGWECGDIELLHIIGGKREQTLCAWRSWEDIAGHRWPGRTGARAGP